MITQTTHLASAEPCGQYPERGVIMAELLFQDLPEEVGEVRPSREGFYWVKVEKFRWVYPTIELQHKPYLVGYWVWEERPVVTPERPIEWDL